jgi:hypothetical protein
VQNSRLETPVADILLGSAGQILPDGVAFRFLGRWRVGGLVQNSDTFSWALTAQEYEELSSDARGSLARLFLFVPMLDRIDLQSVVTDSVLYLIAMSVKDVKASPLPNPRGTVFPESAAAGTTIWTR